ncbi:putative ABC transporter permease [Candidatus Saccharibacteria bacterium]|nr:putative ABC transporter permease [Candidatus Saccharibacteria bacterium]
MLKYRKLFHNYLDDKLKLQPYQKLGVIFLLIVISGFFGWVYEFIFYFFNGGMQEWYMQGGNFLPWINIYAIGSILILLTTYKVKKHPVAIFFISFFVTGILELIAGWLVYTIGNGTRYWDYNTEILNFGNIGGFVCLRSVLFFGFSALLLMYVILPFCIYLSQKLSRKAFLIITITLFSLIMADELYNLTTKIFHLYSAMDFYQALGFKYH